MDKSPFKASPSCWWWPSWAVWAAGSAQPTRSPVVETLIAQVLNQLFVQFVVPFLLFRHFCEKVLFLTLVSLFFQFLLSQLSYNLLFLQIALVLILQHNELFVRISFEAAFPLFMAFAVACGWTYGYAHVHRWNSSVSAAVPCFETYRLKVLILADSGQPDSFTQLDWVITHL